MTVENEQRLVEELRVAVDERDQARAERDVLLNVERAAREVDEHFSGKPERWTYDRKVITTPEAELALLSLHDYLNELAYARLADEDVAIAEQGMADGAEALEIVEREAESG